MTGEGGQGAGWRAVVDNLLVPGFEESRELNTTIRTWSSSLPDAAARMSALGVLDRVIAEIQSVVYNEQILSERSARPADDGTYGRASIASLVGLLVVILAGLLLVILSLRAGRSAETADVRSAARDSTRRGGEAGATGGSAILSDTDPVTGAEGRSVFERTLRGELSRTQRYSHPLSLLAFCVDPVAAGALPSDSADYVFGTIGEIVRNNNRVSDIFARLADNLLVVLLTETPTRGAERVAEKLRRNVEVFPFDDVHPCTASVGNAAVTS